jgi:dolichyl-phosphate-mannose--protein O-mannosyl transferase
LAAVSLLGAALRVWGLWDQPPSSDDIAVAVSAWSYLDTGHLGPTMWNHPPLRNVLVGSSLALFGSNVWGLKLVSLLLGVLAVPLLGVVAWQLFRSPEIATVAALFLAVDALHIDYSRQAVQEVYMMCFTLGGLAAALRFLERRRARWIGLAGLCFGLGLASKWYVAFPLVVTCAWVVVQLGRSGPEDSSRALPDLLLALLALTALPTVVYLLSFGPWFLRGYDLSEWLTLHRLMYLETTTHGGYNPADLEIDRSAWLWFVKPVAYADFLFTEGHPRVLLGVSNPLVWMGTLPAMAYAAVRGLRERSVPLLFLVTLFALPYAALLATDRPIWAHTAFAVLPFALCAVAFSAWELARARRNGRKELAVYLCLVLLVSAPLYLLATGRGMNNPLLRPIIEGYEPSYDWE